MIYQLIQNLNQSDGPKGRFGKVIRGHKVTWSEKEKQVMTF